MNCWEFKGCDANRAKDCPAYQTGRSCWMVSGTLCDGKVQGSFVQKLPYCKECDYFKAHGTLA